MEQKQKRWPAPIDHAYILCDVEREPDRAAYLTTWLQENNLDSSCYTITCKTYGTTLGAEEAMAHYDPFLTRTPTEEDQSIFHSNLKKSEISLLLNWYDVAKQAVEAGHGVVMTLESDVLFPPTFLSDLETALSLLTPGEFDFLSLGSPDFMRPERDDGGATLRWFENISYPKTRTTDAMVFTGALLKKIVNSFFPCADVLDWELNYHLNLHRARAGWVDPPLMRQGSGSVYATTL
jgi:hypothetical protein